MSKKATKFAAVTALMGFAAVSTVTPVSAGELLIDFTAPPGASSALVSGLGPASLTIGLDPSFFSDEGVSPAGDLVVSGFRSAIPTYDSKLGFGRDIRDSKLQLNRSDRGIGVCSDFRNEYRGFGSSLANNRCYDQGSVDGAETIESVDFAISTGIDFAVREFIIGRDGIVGGVGFNDHIVLSGANGFEFSVLIRDVADDDNCRLCVVNVYDLVQNTTVEVLTDDQLYAFIASDSFSISTSDLTDNYYIAGARWVLQGQPGAVPEPATLALFGAGLAGLVGVGRRRRA